MEVVVGEGGVAQAVAEGVGGGIFEVHVGAALGDFVVIHGGEISGGAVEGDGEAAGGVVFAEEDVGGGVAALFAGVPDHEGGGDVVVDPGHADGAAAFEHDDGKGIGLDDFFEEADLIEGEVEGGAVDAFQFDAVVEAGDDDGDVGGSRGGDGGVGVVPVGGADGDAVADGGAEGGEDGGVGIGGVARVGAELRDIGVGADDGDGVDAAEIEGEEFFEAEALGGGIIF